MTANNPPYPFGEPDVLDLGHEVYILWDGDGQGFLWHHAACRPWSFVRFYPDPKSSGHRLSRGGKDDMAHFTVDGSLLCPMSCGEHGFIRDGKWVPA